MKRTALAVLVALSLPAAATADARLEGHAGRHAPPPAAAPAREELALRRLVARYLDALAQPAERRRLARLEGEVGAAIDRELAEARARLAATRPGPWAGGPRGERAAARAQVARLDALRAEFDALSGRFGRRAAARKEALARELLLVAGMDARRVAPRGPALAQRDWR